MTGIGDNGGPPMTAADLFEQEVNDLFQLVSGSTASAVETDEQEQALDQLLADVRRARKDADAKRAEEKAPHLEAGRAVDASWKPLIDKCDAAAKALKDALTPFRVAKQAAKDEAARKAREEAEARQKAAQEAFRQSDDLEARFAAEQELKTASKLTAVANRIDREATGLRTRQVAVVEDYKALLQHIMKADAAPLKTWLDDYARRSLPAQLPGVRIEQEVRAA